MGDPMMTVEDLSTLLKISPRTIYYWRTKGNGPRTYKIGNHLRYRPRDVERWLSRRLDPEPEPEPAPEELLARRRAPKRPRA